MYHETMRVNKGIIDLSELTSIKMCYVHHHMGNC